MIGCDNEEQITVADLTGTGVQDTAIALFAYNEMNEMVNRNLGLKVQNEIAAI